MKVLYIILVSLLISACTTVSNKPISKEALGTIQGKQVISTRYEKPNFSAFTAGKAAFAVIGAVAMISEGNAIVKENDIEDPALSIAAGLQSRLNQSKGTTAVAPFKITDKDDISTVIATNSGADFILDVKTLNWMFNYYSTDWSHYRVTYVARLRLIDSAAKSVVAESACTAVQGDDKNPPTKDQLLENKAELLKGYLSKAATACIDVLAHEVLQL